MALSSYALPFGLRQVKLTPINDDGSLDEASAQLLPASRTFSFSETEDFEELQGDDTTVASHGAGPVVEWELEGGGISLAVWKILSGGTVTESGVTPATVRKFTKKKTDSRPYFQVEGRAISDNGGDFHAIVYRCKADGDLEASMENGSFLLTNASGKGYGDPDTDELYNFLHNETPFSLSPGGNIATSATAGTPGGFNGLPPESLSALNSASITANPSTAWSSGQYVVLGDASHAYWNGTAWVVGEAS